MSAMTSPQALCSERATSAEQRNPLIGNAPALAALRRKSRFRDNKWRIRAEVGRKALLADASRSCRGHAKNSPFLLPYGETLRGPAVRCGNR
jgi:hypothetical protein